ncbi:MAG: hypothetical protein ACXWKJ_16390 [Telluria sp.]
MRQKDAARFRFAVDIRCAGANHAPMTDISREETDAKLATVEARVDARLASLEATMKAGFAEIHVQMAEMRAEMRTQAAELRVELHKSIASLIKWGMGMAVAVIGMTVGLLTYLK